ncbi:MAG: hypothetical protein ACYC3B_05740 [Sedimentisphaerales bacterium]
MATRGKIDVWASRFPDDQISKIFQLILDSWISLKMPSELLEVPITKAFCAHLRNNKKRSEHFFRIDWESHLLDSQGEEIGRIDIMFSQGICETVYFSIECKLLRVLRPNGKFESLASEYVENGMYRYFNGQYATGLDKGGMLGYVMDSKIDSAIDDVRKAVEKRRAELHMKPDGTICCSPVSNSKQVKETTHKNAKFTIYHIFLPIIPVSKK